MKNLKRTGDKGHLCRHLVMVSPSYLTSNPCAEIEEYKSVPPAMPSELLSLIGVPETVNANSVESLTESDETAERRGIGLFSP